MIGAAHTLSLLHHLTTAPETIPACVMGTRAVALINGAITFIATIRFILLKMCPLTSPVTPADISLSCPHWCWKWVTRGIAHFPLPPRLFYLWLERHTELMWGRVEPLWANVGGLKVMTWKKEWIRLVAFILNHLKSFRLIVARSKGALNSQISRSETNFVTFFSAEYDFLSFVFILSELDDLYWHYTCQCNNKLKD